MNLYICSWTAKHLQTSACFVRFHCYNYRLSWCVVSGAGLDILQGPLFIFVFPLSMTKLATKCRMDWNKKALLAGGAAAATLAVLWYLRKASWFVCKVFLQMESRSYQNAKYDSCFVQESVTSRQAKSHGAAEDNLPLKAQMFRHGLIVFIKYLKCEDERAGLQKPMQSEDMQSDE